MVQRIIERYGRRRSVLMLVGIVWMLIGLAIMTEIPAERISGLPHTYIPEAIRVGMWILSGMVAILAAFWQTEHGRSEAVGFAALYLMPAERTLSYFISWISAHELVPGTGLTWGWVYAIQYLCYVGVIYICAGWSDPRREVSA